MIRRRRPRLAYLNLAAIPLVFGLGACGVEEINSSSSAKKSQSEDAEPAAPVEGDDELVFDHVVTPPAAYYDALLAEAMINADKGLQLAAGRAVLWVNFDGATVAKGNDRGQSFIPCSASSTIPAADLSAADRDQVIALVQQHFDDTGAGLTVTPVKPAAGDFAVMHVGGAYGDLGCPGGRGILGVAPFDVGDRNKNDIGFAFTKGINSVRVIAETVSHEAGHSYGLDHVRTQSDLMFASSSGNITGFGVAQISGSTRTQDAPAVLKLALGTFASDGSTPPAANPGPATPAPATPIPGLPNIPGGLAGLPGLDQIASIGALLPGLSGVNIADISQLLPQLTGLLPGAAGAIGTPGLDQILTIVGLASAAGAGQNGAALPGIGALPINPALAAGILNPSSLAGLGNLGNLAGLASLGGFASLPAGVADIGTLLGGLIGGQAPAAGGNLAAVPSISQLPDLSALLGLAAGGGAGGLDLATLVGNFTGSAQVVNSNFQGAQADALLSLLKVGYSQARQGITTP